MDNAKEKLSEEIEETRAALGEKLSALEQQASETVAQTSDAIAETVSEIRETVEESIQSFKNAFDFKLHVRNHPFTMVIGATAVGYLSEAILYGGRHSNGNGNGASHVAPAYGAASYREKPHTGEGSGAAHAFHSLLQEGALQLRGVALGTLLGLVRDIALDNLPESLERSVASMLDSAAISLGAQPLHRQSHETGTHGRASEAHAAQRDADDAANDQPSNSARPSTAIHM